MQVNFVKHFVKYNLNLLNCQVTKRLSDILDIFYKIVDFLANTIFNNKASWTDMEAVSFLCIPFSSGSQADFKCDRAT